MIGRRCLDANVPQEAVAAYNQDRCAEIIAGAAQRQKDGGGLIRRDDENVRQRRRFPRGRTLSQLLEQCDVIDAVEGLGGGVLVSSGVGVEFREVGAGAGRRGISSRRRFFIGVGRSRWWNEEVGREGGEFDGGIPTRRRTNFKRRGYRRGRMISAVKVHSIVAILVIVVVLHDQKSTHAGKNQILDRLRPRGRRSTHEDDEGSGEGALAGCSP